jgi:hypothetical protein
MFYLLSCLCTAFTLFAETPLELAQTAAAPVEIEEARQIAALPAGVSRIYERETTPQEKKDLRFIVKTLADCSLPSIWSQQSAIEKAGDRIESLHPLRFLLVIFEDDELKTCLQNIRSRNFVSSEFFAGISKSLTSEKQKNNLTTTQINDFAAKLGIDPKLLSASVQRGNWAEFLDTLIKHLPRKGNSSRYNI